MGIIFPLIGHNSPEVLVTQWIIQEQYRYSKFIPVHNIKMITEILQRGSPTELSLSLVLTLFFGNFNHSINFFSVWVLSLAEKWGGVSPSPSFSSLFFENLECSCQNQSKFSSSWNIPRFQCWVILKTPWPMWGSLKLDWDLNWIMWLESGKIN